MSAQHTPGPILMQRAHSTCEAVASGPFTPIVLERYEWIGGERGVRLGYQSNTANGWTAIVWTHRAAIAKASGSSS
ncbi:hypothetical protein WIX39_018825 [Variovorax sp. AB1(2024)]|uniref:hypothetical protein n=1 Tax=Variovorax sp. AB1(2024) TaxID=3132214 RepID=UPI00309B9064